MLKYGQLN